MSGSCGSCQNDDALRLTVINSENAVYATDTTFDQERLGPKDIEFLKTLRRAFESISMGNRPRVPVEGGIVFITCQN